MGRPSITPGAALLQGQPKLSTADPCGIQHPRPGKTVGFKPQQACPPLGLIVSAAKGKEALFVSLYYLFVETNHLKPRYISFSVFDNHTVRHSNRSPSLSK